jgi:DNA-binding GntR family transcriptional regulator
LVPPDDANSFSRRTSGEQAALYIRRLIFDGKLRPGTRIDQDEIADTLRISRIPLREGLITLEREGWVTSEIHRGVFVNAFDAAAVDDHFEMLGLLYTFAIQRAIQHWDDEVIGGIEAIQERLEANRNPMEAGSRLFPLYTTLVDAARSPRLKVNLRAISSLVPGDFFSAVPDAIDLERRAWAKIIRALRRKEADKAIEEFLRMMRRVSKEVTRLFEERGLFAGVEQS